MKVTATTLSGVLVVEPLVYQDSRGLFLESYRVDRYATVGIRGPFVQDNVSRSRRGVLRGLHLQNPHGQDKLVSVVSGEVFDVAVDVRVGSPSYGNWVGEVLSASNNRQLYLPRGFAHGFLALSTEAIVAYKATDYYHPASEIVIRWNDPRIGIQWPIDPTGLSDRDRTAPLLSDLNERNLPRV